VTPDEALQCAVQLAKAQSIRLGEERQVIAAIGNEHLAATLARLRPFVDAAMAYCEPRREKNYGGAKWAMMEAYRALVVEPVETEKGAG